MICIGGHPIFTMKIGKDYYTEIIQSYPVNAEFWWKHKKLDIQILQNPTTFGCFCTFGNKLLFDFAWFTVVKKQLSLTLFDSLGFGFGGHGTCESVAVTAQLRLTFNLWFLEKLRKLRNCWWRNLWTYFHSLWDKQWPNVAQVTRQPAADSKRGRPRFDIKVTSCHSERHLEQMPIDNPTSPSTHTKSPIRHRGQTPAT